MTSDHWDDSIVSRAAKKVFSRRGKNVEQNHEELMSNIARDPNVDYGDDDLHDDTEYGSMHGFVGLMSPAFLPPLDLSHWDTLNICVKTDGGPWLASLKPQTMLANELWIAGLPGPNGEVIHPRHTTGFGRKAMRNLFVPITSLTVSQAGRNAVQQDANNQVPAQGFGFSIRGPPGPFKLEIGWIAVADSTKRIVQHQTVHLPSTKLNVELSRETVALTSNLNDDELFEFTAQHKPTLDQLAKTRASEVQIAAGKDVIDYKNAISVAEIESNVVSKEKRKAFLVNQFLRENNGRIELTPQQLKMLRDLEHSTPQLNTLDKNQAVRRLELELEDYQKELENAGVSLKELENEKRMMNKSGQDDSNSVAQEEAILKLQQRARDLTSTDLPLIVPTFNETDVMKTSRIKSVELGLVEEETFKRYAAPVDPHEYEKKATLQSVDDLVRLLAEEKVKAKVLTGELTHNPFEEHRKKSDEMVLKQLDEDPELRELSPDVKAKMLQGYMASKEMDWKFSNEGNNTPLPDINFLKEFDRIRKEYEEKQQTEVGGKKDPKH